jgi:hypothetical protein
MIFNKWSSLLCHFLTSYHFFFWHIAHMCLEIGAKRFIFGKSCILSMNWIHSIWLFCKKALGMWVFYPIYEHHTMSWRHKSRD